MHTNSELEIFNGGIAVSTTLHFLSLMQIGKSNKYIQEYSSKFDKILGYLMNSNAIELSKEELVNRYGYPEADLSEIDLAWI
jgi:hypothetical protein